MSINGFRQVYLKLLISLLVISFTFCIFSLWKAQITQTSPAATNPTFSFTSQHGYNGQAQQHQRFSSKQFNNWGPSSKQGQTNQAGNIWIHSNNGFNPPSSHAFSNSSQSVWNKMGLGIYSVLFFGGLIGWLLVRRKGLSGVEFRPNRAYLLSLLGIGLFLRIALAPWTGGQMDLRIFESWSQTAARGLSQFYAASSSDYPPFYIYILFLIGKLSSLSNLSSQMTLFIKLPSIFADVATSGLLYRLALRKLSSLNAFLIAGFYLFNPAIFINSVFWGQVDSFFTLVLVLALTLLIDKRILGATILFIISVLIKPQGIIFLPLLFFELVRQKRVKPFVSAALISFSLTELICYPFSKTLNPIWLINLFSKTISEFPYASVNGYNFYALIGANYVKSSQTLFLFSYHTWGLISIVLITTFSWFIYIKNKNLLMLPSLALVEIAGVFTFSTSMHERYLFSAAVLGLLSYIFLRDKRFIWLTLGFSLTSFVNQYAVLYSNSGFGGSSYTATLFFISLLNVCLFIWLIKVVWDCTFKTSIAKSKSVALITPAKG